MNDQTGGFDPNVFLQATTAEANTRRNPVPAGTTLVGTLGEPKITTSEGKQEKNLGQVYVFCNIPVEIDLTQNPSIHAHVGMDKLTLQYRFGVDFLPGGTGFDMAKGKNNGLRALREALGMNVQGQPFNLMMVIGRQVTARIGNRPGRPGEDVVYDEVSSVAAVK